MKPHVKLQFWTVVSCFLLIATSAKSLQADVSYEHAFAHDRQWPSHVQLAEDLVSKEGERLLRADLPLVLIRAYEDGMLAVIDRSGIFFVAAHKTDFLSKVSTHQAKPEETGNFSNFLNQIGRRVFNFEYDEEKAVPEKELSQFEAFLICRTSADEETLSALLQELEALQLQLESAKIEPVLVFKEAMTNRVFYDLVKAVKMPHPAVVPIFQRGFTDAVYTEREAGHDFLLIAQSGKLLASSSTPTKALMQVTEAACARSDSFLESFNDDAGE